ncbi:MAG: hypothetical protein PHC56_04595 [Herbinix sp.]|nr:hypothetical protein [Herbinix sp.]
MDSIKIYKYDSNKVWINESKDLYFVKTDESFYNPDKEVFESVIDSSKLEYQKTIKDNPIYCMSMILIIVATIFTYLINVSYIIIDNNLLYSTLILLINIVIHETGHILFLKLFYKESKIKAGFKFLFIYPAFYVDTSYTYMLPKYKRMAVYLAGSAFNTFYVILSMVFIPKHNNYLYLVVSNILVNFLPIIKSDGYYTLMALLGKYNKSKGKLPTFIEDIVRGIIMFIFLYLTSMIF